MTTLNGMPGIETTEFLLSKIDDFGTPDAYNHYAVGWAHALCAPYQWTKQVASHWGGTRNGTIVHWPKGFADKGEVRNQFHHVIDVAPTILEAAGLPAPTLVNGIAQAPLEGVSMLATLRDGEAPETHDVQYFEMMGNRGIYHQGWTAVTKHRTPWKADTPPPFDDDVWELYGPDDWTQAHDLAAENPEKLAELQRLWLIEAVKYNVVPLDDRGFERINPDIAGPPAADPRQHASCCSTGMRVSENCVLTLKNKSHSVTANIDRARVRRQRRHHHPGRQRRRLVAVRARGQAEVLLQLLRHRALHHQPPTSRSPPASTRCGWSSPTTAAVWPRVATSRCTTTARPSARAASSRPCRWGTRPTRPAMSAPTPGRRRHRTTGRRATAFTGEIEWVQLDIGEDGHDHLITAEERFNMAMARQ